MSQVAQGSPTPATPSAASNVGEALVFGRIEHRRRVKARDGASFVLTLLRLPAPDQFTSPQTVEVRSSAAIGEVGESWRGKVRIGGYGRQYHVDGQDGERTAVRTADNILTVVE